MQKIVLIILNLIINYKIVRKNFYDEINKINKKTTFRFYNEKKCVSERNENIYFIFTANGHF